MRVSGDDMRKLEYLFRFSCKYDVSFEKLAEAIVDAEQKGSSKCRGLTIQRRARTEEGSVFLINSNRDYLAQIRLEEDFLEKLVEGRLSEVSLPSKHRRSDEKDQRTGDLKISDLHVGMRGVLLEAKVVEKSPSRRVYSRFKATPLDISIITVEDDTGSIPMSLWNEKIDSVSVGDKIRISGVRVGRYGGVKQLFMNKRYSTLSVMD